VSSVYVLSRWDWGGGGDDDRVVLAVYTRREDADAVTALGAAVEVREVPLDPDRAESLRIVSG
jgi:hypothetical protein